ncbi:uncharacterized protein LOC110023693 [Phalaenopsis equestris]|uniref:uncharacterized protein LOC110023693 n=1 Tax=Phalaenopsis equestris TaxID=78828 RepID=UPI0009E2D81A|nr:uncharacterized protein LOC110023693 [Phalaenopsis equestris]
MAFSKIQVSAVFSYPYGSRIHHARSKFQHIGFLEYPTSSPPSSRNSSRLRRSLNRFHAVAPPSDQISCGSSLLLDEEVGVNLLNGFGELPCFPHKQKYEKMVVAVDIDEVLGSFLSPLNKFITDHYGLDHDVSEYHVYEFFRIWNCSRAEADMRVHEFYNSPYFRFGIDPIPGSQKVLRNLSAFCSLSIVTSRQNVIKEKTFDWIEKHYAGIFKEIQFGNHFALNGKSRPKSDICRSVGAEVLIDDNPKYAFECAEAGIKVLLFDYHNTYPWCKHVHADSHSLITKVYSWEEVEQYLISWVAVWK